MPVFLPGTVLDLAACAPVASPCRQPRANGVEARAKAFAGRCANLRGDGIIRWSDFVSGLTSVCVRRFRAAAFAATLPALLAACSAIQVPTAEDLMPQAPKFELKTLPSSPIRRLGPPTLVGPDGACTAASGQSDFSGAGISLRMSECDVVQRAGPPQNIDISAAPNGERMTVMTYGGDHAGIYRFTAGRLVRIERGAEQPVEPERPAKKKSPKRSASSSAS